MLDLVFLMVFALLGSSFARRNLPEMLDLSETCEVDGPASYNIKILEKTMNRIYFGVDMNQLYSSEHSGTQIEAPTTFGYGTPVDDIPIERLWRVPGLVIDVSSEVHPHYKITSEVLIKWEREMGLTITDYGIVLIHTGFQARVKVSNGGLEKGIPSPQPALSVDAALWLLNDRFTYGRQRGIVGVGIDLNSLDENDTNATTSSREKLYRGGIYAIHNLKNLHMLPSSGFYITVMPVKIQRGSSAPARVFAERSEIRTSEESRPTFSGRNISVTTETSDYMSSSRDKYADWHSESDFYERQPWIPHHVSMSKTSTGIFSSCQSLVVTALVFLFLTRF